MEKHEAMNGILNDLVKINNDRIAGYERAIKESKDLDIDLKAIFEEMIRQSAAYKEDLTKYIQNDGGIAEDDITTSGKIYHAWMDIKSTFTDSDRHSILAACEFGEDAAQRAYKAALDSDGLTEPDARKLVEEEQAALKKSHDLIKTARNAHKVFQK
jgi:uncharacterized protein (TIGR02284 family)